jgi:hypothetical protein
MLAAMKTGRANSALGRSRVVAVSLVAGLCLAGTGLLLDVRGVFNCDSWVQSCTASWAIFWAVVLTPWLVATFVLAVRQSVTAFSCVVLAAALSVALSMWILASAELNLDHDYVGNNDVSEGKAYALLILIAGVPIVAAATAVVGLVLQSVMVPRRLNGSGTLG